MRFAAESPKKAASPPGVPSESPASPPRVPRESLIWMCHQPLSETNASPPDKRKANENNWLVKTQEELSPL